MKDFDVDKLLEIQIKSQASDIDTSDEFTEKETLVLVKNTNDEHLKGRIGQIGKADSTIRYAKGVKKTKVIFSDGESAYFKNEYLEKVVG